MRSAIRPDGQSSSVCAAENARWARIAAGMDVSRPAVSQHLRVLEAARLVTDLHSTQTGGRHVRGEQRRVGVVAVVRPDISLAAE
jgi:DNA-binding transcriptional ArsR family regulator